MALEMNVKGHHSRTMTRKRSEMEGILTMSYKWSTNTDQHTIKQAPMMCIRLHAKIHPMNYIVFDV
eukprot:858360-Amphidinium_carterae.1